MNYKRVISDLKEQNIRHYNEHYELLNKMVKDHQQALRTQAEEIFSEIERKVFWIGDMERYSGFAYKKVKQKFLASTGKAGDSSSPEVAGNMGGRKKADNSSVCPASAPALPDRKQKRGE